MKELWLGLVEVIIEPDDSENTKGFMNIVTWAETDAQFEEQVNRCFHTYGWFLIGVEECAPIRVGYGYGEEVAEMIERARVNPLAVLYGTFHRYPSRPI